MYNVKKGARMYSVPMNAHDIHNETLTWYMPHNVSSVIIQAFTKGSNYILGYERVDDTVQL